MNDCVFSGYCSSRQTCDMSCPIWAQSSYLFERNEISMKNSVFSMTDRDLARYQRFITRTQEELDPNLYTYCTHPSKTGEVADALTYVAICQNWKGSALHCVVYNLKFNKYLDVVQKSWSFGSDTTEAEMMKIWATSAPILIVSALDYVNFKDYPCQTLLSLLQERNKPELATIVVTPAISNLVGEGPFFGKLTQLLREHMAA